MVVEPLLLPRNDYSDMVLRSLGATSKVTARRLSIIQNAAIYYQCLVTKRRAGTMSTKQRDAHARKGYRDYTVPAFLCWWKRKCDIDLPSWLTKDLMGGTTQNDKDLKLYNVDGKLWGKYAEGGREIRRDFLPSWTRFRVDDELPSGENADTQWADMQDRLWIIDRKIAEKKKEVAAANAARKANPVDVENEILKSTAGKKAPAKPVNSEKEAMQEVGASPAPAGPSAAAPRKLSSAQKSGKTTTVEDVLGPEPEIGDPGLPRWLAKKAAQQAAIEAAAAAAAAAGATASGGGSLAVKQEGAGEGVGLELEPEDWSNGDDLAHDLEIYGERPGGWLHQHSLTFALFGRPAGDHEDVDLKLLMSSGPTRDPTKTTNAGRRESSDSAGSEESASRNASDGEGDGTLLSKRSLKTMNGAGGAGGSLSRGDVKKEKHAQNSSAKKAKDAEDLAALRQRVFEKLAAPQEESKSAQELSASVALLTQEVVRKGRIDEENARRARWQQEVDAKEKKLAMWDRRGQGDTPKARELERELETLYDNPVVAPLPEDTPPADTPCPGSTCGDSSPAEDLVENITVDGAATSACGLNAGGGGAPFLPGFSGTNNSGSTTAESGGGADFAV